MKVTYNWLDEYVDLSDLKPEKVSGLFTSIGIGIENLEKKIINRKEDFVFDLEITPNRPDYLSILGIARLLTSLLNRELEIPDISIKKSNKISKVKIEIRDKDQCLRYTGRVVNNVRINQSPTWIKDRLSACGIRSINNIVDITNYVLLEFGHPIHAFDYDKLEDKTIIVRFAREGEKIITLDGVERKLDERILVIADRSKPVALAGIMGGENTEVKENTKNVLIESAYFVPRIVRNGSKILNLTTESSYRFERGTDYDIVSLASDRAAQLMQEESSGEVSGIVDLKVKTMVPAEINLRVDRTNKILGTDLTNIEIERILNKLYFKTKKDGKKLLVTVPNFRNEVSREIDLIEEVAQIYGFNKINSVLPTITIHPSIKENTEIIEDNIKDLLIGFGFYEVINSGFMDSKFIEMFIEGKNNTIKIINPLVTELNSMRTTLLFGLLENVKHNINNGITNIKIFEIGNVFTLNTERKSIGIIITGLTIENTWNISVKNVDFFELKGIIEILFDKLNVKDYKFCKIAKPEIYNEDNLTINISNIEIGTFGEVNDSILRIFAIKEKVYFAEIYLHDLIKYSFIPKEFCSLPRYPAIKRDLAIIVKNNIEYSLILEYIKSTGAELLESVQLIDFYRGTQIPDGCRSLTIRLSFRSRERTLTDQEVNIVHEKIVKTLKDKVEAIVRG